MKILVHSYPLRSVPAVRRRRAPHGGRTGYLGLRVAPSLAGPHQRGCWETWAARPPRPPNRWSQRVGTRPRGFSGPCPCGQPCSEPPEGPRGNEAPGVPSHCTPSPAPLAPHHTPLQGPQAGRCPRQRPPGRCPRACPGRQHLLLDWVLTKCLQFRSVSKNSGSSSVTSITARARRGPWGSASGVCSATRDVCAGLWALGAPVQTTRGRGCQHLTPAVLQTSETGPHRESISGWGGAGAVSRASGGCCAGLGSPPVLAAGSAVSGIRAAVMSCGCGGLAPRSPRGPHSTRPTQRRHPLTSGQAGGSRKRAAWGGRQ